jgi:pimeloyl-ACP methyl ester carboxylesterase
MKVKSNIIVESSYHNKPILTDVYYSQNNILKPIVIFCHGYKGFKDWGAWDMIAKKMARNDVFFLKFNFSHSGGTVKNPIDFSDLEAFGNNNYSIELNDLEDIINWISKNNEYKNEIDIHNITLIGHSRGGGIVTIKASENEKVSRIISWNGVSDYDCRFLKGEELKDWKNTGVRYITNSRTKQQMPHFYQFFEDFEQNKERLSIENAVKKLQIPHLIISGDNDTVVKPFEGENLHQWNPKSQLVCIEGMNHTLGAKHPWNEKNLPIHLEKVIELSLDFIKS